MRYAFPSVYFGHFFKSLLEKNENLQLQYPSYSYNCSQCTKDQFVKQFDTPYLLFHTQHLLQKIYSYVRANLYKFLHPHKRIAIRHCKAN